MISKDKAKWGIEVIHTLETDLEGIVSDISILYVALKEVGLVTVEYNRELDDFDFKVNDGKYECCTKVIHGTKKMIEFIVENTKRCYYVANAERQV